MLRMVQLTYSFKAAFPTLLVGSTIFWTLKRLITNVLVPYSEIQTSRWYKTVHQLLYNNSRNWFTDGVHLNTSLRENMSETTASSNLKSIQNLWALAETPLTPWNGQMIRKLTRKRFGVAECLICVDLHVNRTVYLTHLGYRPFLCQMSTKRCVNQCYPEQKKRQGGIIFHLKASWKVSFKWHKTFRAHFRRKCHLFNRSFLSILNFALAFNTAFGICINYTLFGVVEQSTNCKCKSCQHCRNTKNLIMEIFCWHMELVALK